MNSRALNKELGYILLKLKFMIDDPQISHDSLTYENLVHVCEKLKVMISECGGG